MKTWERWTQTTQSFPKPKYNFTNLLKREGDYIETFPFPKKDRDRFKDAAKFWAYYHNKTINIKFISDYQDGIPMWRVRITLKYNHRKRDLPTL